jgi:hypothetical protein
MSAPVEHTCPRCRSTWLPRIAHPVRCPRCQTKLARARPVEPLCRCGHDRAQHAWGADDRTVRLWCQVHDCSCAAFAPRYPNPEQEATND